MMQIDALSLLYFVLAIGLIPVFVLLCMNLWKLFKLLNHADTVLGTAEDAIKFTKTQAVNIIKNIETAPSRLMNSALSSIRRFF